MAGLALLVASFHAALALRQRWRCGLCEVILIAFLFFSSAIAVMMFGLAAAAAVSARSIAIATWIVSITVIAIASRGHVRRVVALWQGLGAAMRSRARHERPLFHVSLFVIASLFFYSLLQAWLLPSDSWDGIWYHDMITGSVINTGEMRPIPLPMNLIQQANGFPKLAELTSAWWCLTLGREASEFSNLLAVPPFGAGVYLLARRFSARDVAIGIACVVLLVPGSVLQWRTTYVDILVAAFGVAALHFASASASSRGRGLLFALSMGLAVLTKWNVLPLIPGVILVWLVASPVRRTWSDWAVHGAVILVPLLALAITVVPNVRNFDNPLWPIGVSLPRLGVEWPGVRASDQMNFNASAGETAAATLLPVAPGRDFADIRKGGYGLAFPWLLVPSAVLSVAALVVHSQRRDSGDRRAAEARRGPILRACVLLGPVVPCVAVSPAVWSARYLLVAVAALAAVSMAALSIWGSRGRRLGSVLLAVAIAMSLHRAWTFAPPLGGASVGETWRALARSPEDRTASPPAPWTISPDVAVFRERELTRGTVVVFSDEVAFPAVLYNDRFDNQVVYVPGAGALEDAVERLQPTWIVASDEEPLGLWVRARAEQWEPIGLASRGLPTTAYRRRSRPDPR